jgi:hypothetical protein
MSALSLTPLEARVAAAAKHRDGTLSEGARKREGIVHTPPELARFVARAVDQLLVQELGLTGGIADTRATLIDPACGPGAFIAAAHAVAGERSTKPRAVIGVDRDAGALAQLQAARTGVQADTWPIALRCADALETPVLPELAARADVVALLGNPPWIGTAQPAASAWLEALLEELRRDASGARLLERKLGVLSDAYVRFMAVTLAAARAATGGAVIGLVTNASYLDGPVHRGLRGALARSFDRLHVIDLGGSALLARAAHAEADGNVFGVRTPAAILLGARGPGEGERAARIQYSRLRGDVGSKLEQLGRAALSELDAQVLSSAAPAFRLAPARSAPPEYASWPALDALMPFHREGVQTNRDEAVIDADARALLARLRAFADGPSEQPALRRLEQVEDHYDPEAARRGLRASLASPALAELLRPIAYRPFDTRFFAALAPLCHRPRPDLLAAMSRSSFALITARKDRSDVRWHHIAASRAVVDNSFLSTRSSCRARGVPTHTPDGHENLDRSAAAALLERAGRVLRVEEVACYALASLSSPAYQARYAAWLRTDYPRVPLPDSATAFEATLARGQRLLELWCAPLQPVAASTDAERSSAAAIVVGHHHVLARWRKGQGDLDEAQLREAENALIVRLIELEKCA